MALCRLEAKIISRSGGRSSVGAASYRTGKCATSAAAYRAGAELKDERTGAVYDYTRKRGVLGAEIMLPQGAPFWMADRGQLWNAVEKAEKRADAQLARDYILTLPHELDAAQRRDLTRDYVQRQFVDKGYVADIAWHAPHGKGDERNHHAHVMVVMRRVDENGFARTKDRAPEGKHPAEHWKTQLREQRESWANAGADALKAAGLELQSVRFRAGHLTLEKQREAAIARGDLAWAETLDREAEPKQGPLATKIEQEGRESHAGNDRRDVQARNAARAELKAEHARVTAEIIDFETARQARREKAMSDTNTVETDISEAEQIRQRERLVRETELLKDAERQQEQQWSARRLREQAEQDAEQARKTQKQREMVEADRAAAGDITDARNRYAQALGEKYSITNPYGSLAEAAMAEYGKFAKQQEELRKEAAAAKDPDKRKLIELRREIEAHDYMAITSERLAGISRAITMSDNTSAQRDDAMAKAHQERAAELRRERTDLQRDIRQRETDERGAKERGGLGSAGQPGAAVVGNPKHARTRSRAEEAEIRAAGAHYTPPEQREEQARAVQRDEAAKREGLKPDQPTETAPQTKEERRLSAAEQAERAAAGSFYRPAEDGRDKARQAERPTGRGGGRGR